MHPSDKWSADYPGRVVASLEGRSPGMQAMFLGGVLGAFNPAAGRTYENTTAIGRGIADSAWTAAQALKPVQAKENVLRMAVREKVALGPGDDVPARQFLRLPTEHLRNEIVLWQALGPRRRTSRRVSNNTSSDSASGSRSSRARWPAICLPGRPSATASPLCG